MSAEPLNLLAWSLSALLAYLVGSIPVGLLIGFSRGVDIRAQGSGNIGATNAMRVLGRKAGLACLALDIAKGLAPALLAGLLLGASDASARQPAVGWLWMGLAAAAILGHMFPLWLRFRGGKGVATGFGALLGIWPVMTLAALASLIVWLVSVRVSRYVGLSSCIAAGCLPGFAALAWLGRARLGGLETNWPASVPFLASTALLAGLVIWRHRGNLARTLAGVEPKVGEPAAPPQAAAPNDRPPPSD